MDAQQQQIDTTKESGKAADALERAYYHRLGNSYKAAQDSRQFVYRRYQLLHEHHAGVQDRYLALIDALGSGQDPKYLWQDYHQAVQEHRHLVRAYRAALLSHRRRLEANNQR